MHSRIKKFISYYRPYRGRLAADMVCAVTMCAAALALPLCVRFITQILIDSGAQASLPRLFDVAGLMIVLVAIHTLCGFFVDHRGHAMGALMERDMRRDLFEHLQKMSFRFFDERKTGQLMSRVTNDLLWLSELYHHGPEDLVIAVSTLVGVLAVSLSINPRLTSVVFVFIPLMAGYAFYFHRRMMSAIAESRERISDVNAQVEDTLAGARVVKSFTNEEIETGKFRHENERFLASRVRGYRSEAFFSSGLVASTQLITIAVVLFGGVSIARHLFSLPDLLTYLLYVGIIADPVQRLVNFARLYQEGITGFNRFMELLEVPPEPSETSGGYIPSTVRGRIEFQNVGFRYHEEHQLVLRGITLSIRAGELVAIVGPSGVGKSTLCSLVPRFYDVTDGRILLDGVDVRDIDVRSLRRSIGVVQQDVYLFAGTVMENITYGRPGAGTSEIIDAARKANAHEFIMRLPAGYDTDIGQRGVKLSGGQKQRLSIARAFLKNPPVLIFDEATSSLDNESERAIQESMEALAKDRTTLVIAHRLSTVRKAGRIVVLTERGIEEEGSHRELMELDRIYARLYKTQLEV